MKAKLLTRRRVIHIFIDKSTKQVWTIPLISFTGIKPGGCDSYLCVLDMISVSASKSNVFNLLSSFTSVYSRCAVHLSRLRELRLVSLSYLVYSFDLRRDIDGERDIGLKQTRHVAADWGCTLSDEKSHGLIVGTGNGRWHHLSFTTLKWPNV